MARGNTSQTRLRLTFNFRTGAKSREKIRTFANTMVQEVAVNASDQMWKEIKVKIASRLERDVFSEIAKMAQLYKQYIIGIGAMSAGANGTLTPASLYAEGTPKGDRSYSLGRGPAGRWAKRKPSYLTWKRRHVGHNRWFEHSGLMSLNMGRGKFWTKTFGPIHVDVRRTQSMGLADANRLANSQGTRAAREQFLKRFDTGGPSNSGSSLRVHVANIRVSAMQGITPAMLPSLLTGNVDDVAPDGRKTGLIRQFPRRMQWHLAGGEKFVPYRHTIEPFLGFVLTKAIPNAVARRIEDGLGGSIRFISTKADRFEKFTDYSGL